ncbi:MAG: 50S ribosomal protein L18 [Nitrosopumilus sp.]|uniref:50S ribosomal protein L18 n=1 Tax=Nitrosopumilus sp. b3 TaxID=2109909 RepID=UPI000A68B1E5|nr:50S ribosomal protein L18 [Nitrosopumilus sp. b3]MBT8172861.1 50S ribosomal protein L18 [Nitrosopumilus sp.]KAF6246429.1 50S ribosomal protein L18 [Nitrosopumilus sp. b3]MBT8251310.1 50S ribosomal protein L18 [Nitrosopumilus sp.]NNL52477.1 50S ribosomal protein L18 [Nitrosopumilus sp.]NNL58191.1 50S ribosomal protein L18 [Nitrosopumilus sp.]
MAYSKILRRLREEKTNYKKRGTMLMGKRDFITVNITNENTQVQILKPGMEGDKVVASAHSRYLLEKGWKGSRKSVPAAYLTGYLAGKKALGQGAKDAILYTGTRRYTQRMAAALKGVIDAGVEVPANEETFPPEDRINGEHLTVKNEVSKMKSTIDSEVK